MVNIDIYLKRVPMIPDGTGNMKFLFEDRANPMRDAQGNIIPSSPAVYVNGVRQPAYCEYPVTLERPEGPVTTEMINSLKAVALETAKNYFANRVTNENIRVAAISTFQAYPVGVVEFSGDVIV
jgi:propanediol dehydratase small subunit